MRFFTRIWEVVTYYVSWSSLDSFDRLSQQQLPLPAPTHPHAEPSAPLHVDVPVDAGFPIFKPPGGRPNGPQSNFTCQYPRMLGWEFCSTPDNRDCWLRDKLGHEYNLHTDYENDAPIGIDRYYILEASDFWINADGMNFTDAKVFNKQFPGPLLEACWGDTLHVKVINNMKWNGTSIHWHGIRQLNSMQMDGVNGVTQCPIAPGDSFVYVFKAMQYGSSWYHSHYSVQYADGLQGPITLYGPSSGIFDEAKYPLLMTDWGHNSAFQAIYSSVNNQSIVLNGTGDITTFNGQKNTSVIPAKYTLNFEPVPVDKPAKIMRYLLRIINTSFDTTFIFSIDNHILNVISADFVPIEPYESSAITVGIGQRYTVVVDAYPHDSPLNPRDPDGNYWIRTYVAQSCGTPGSLKHYEQTGVLRYGNSNKDPTSQPWPNIDLTCIDEPYDLLRPIRPWFVGQPINRLGNSDEQFNVHLGRNGIRPNFSLSLFSMQPSAKVDPFNPLQINYDDPTFLHLDDNPDTYPQAWVVIPTDYGDNAWVYLVVTGQKRTTTYGAHPIHLHGHDFAILNQTKGVPFPDDGQVVLNLDNPPRRDVVLLPRNGFIVIGFKADNPGNWLMHCHIAYHASFGLGLQLLEDQKAAAALWPPGSPAIQETKRVCGNWITWFKNCKNHWPGLNQTTGKYPACETNAHFQDDSGI